MRRGLLILICLLMFGFNSHDVWAKANVRRGHLYFQGVCQACHLKVGALVDPKSRTIDDWVAYLSIDRHAVKSSAEKSIHYYLGRSYREQIKDSNKVAKKFLALSENALFQDIRAFFMKHASDYDGPSPCQ